MTAVTWEPNGGRLNSYRASIDHVEWVLELKRVGWVLVNLSYRMHDVFVASVNTDASERSAGRSRKRGTSHESPHRP